jgi:hypothetical protein
VINCEHVAVFPHASVALYVRVIVNLFAQVKFEMTSFSNVTEADPPQLSLVVTVAGFTGGTWLAHMTVTFCGQDIKGGV